MTWQLAGISTDAAQLFPVSCSVRIVYEQLGPLAQQRITLSTLWQSRRIYLASLLFVEVISKAFSGRS